MSPYLDPQQIREAFPWNAAPRTLIRDNDRKYGDVFLRTVRACGIRDRPIAPHSPWQNGYVERVIGSIRRECLDHVIAWNEAHLRRLLAAYADYYNTSRTRLALGKDAPGGSHRRMRKEDRRDPRLGGLHHRYGRCANAKDSDFR